MKAARSRLPSYRSRGHSALSQSLRGVETETQLDALKSRGCDAIQGFFISKPLEADDFRSFIRAKDLLAELSSPA